MIDSADRKALSSAWNELSHALANSQCLLDRHARSGRWGAADDPVERSEAYDYWAQVLTFALRREFHYRLVDHPTFHRIGLDTKIGFDNPDNVYQIAMIDPGQVYRITGDMGGAQFIEISVSVGFPGVVVPPRTIAKFDSTEFVIGSDGRIEIAVGGERHGANWLPLEPDATSVLVRQVFGEWRADAVPGDFRIVRVSGEGDRSPPIAPISVADRLQRATEFYTKQSTYWLDYADGLVARIAPNTFEAPGEQGKALQQVNAARAFFCWGLWDLASDEALVVEMPKPMEGAYLGFHLNNYWLQSLDYVGRITSLNGSQVQVDEDGVIRYVLAHNDPGVPNWMDVGDHPRGAMLFRQALTTRANQPIARVVPFAGLRTALPAGTPSVSASERAAQIAARRAHVASRFRW